MTIIVGGYGRKAGKTTAVCDIIAATVTARWTAIKVTAHAHGADLTSPVLITAATPDTQTDTGRYLQAGAARSHWLRCTQESLQAALTPLIQGNTIIESNSAVGLISADLIVFLAGGEPSEWKDSAMRAAQKTDLTVYGRLDEQTLERIRQVVVT